MKKILNFLMGVLLTCAIFLVGFNHEVSKKPNVFYRVYLKNKEIGIIESKKELETYINKQAEDIRLNLKKYSSRIESINTYNKYSHIVELNNFTEMNDRINYLLTNYEKYKITDEERTLLRIYKDNKLYNLSIEDIEEIKKYIKENDIYNHVDEVFSPDGIEIKKVYTYKGEISTVSEIYKKIMTKESCTIAGYKFTIKSHNEGVKDIVLYTLDTEIFEKSIEDLITIFVDDEDYEKYKLGKQEEIEETGSLIENIYVDEEITYKAVNVPVTEKIYTNSTELSAYLLYGDTYTEKTVKVKPGDSIESLTMENKISVQEFLIFNDQYTSRDNLLVPNTDVIISTVDPKIQVVVETFEVIDKETSFSTQEKYDSTINQGSVLVTQQGKKGLERIRQNVKSINGNISYVDPQGKELIQSPVPQIISIGTKYIPHIGSTASWGWPTDSGYTISSYYGYRLAVFGEGNFHNGLDIAGTGYGSNIYAVNNGTIMVMEDLGNYSYGKYITINHNNGYYTTYGHMSGFKAGLRVGATVSRGDVIGYIGSSGWSTGPHVHYEVRNCPAYNCTFNPLSLYR